jgi:PKD repeat protein
MKSLTCKKHVGLFLFKSPSLFNFRLESTMKTTSALLLFGVGLTGLQACVNPPVACFTNDKNDTVRANFQVEFFSCSTDTETHHWDFGDSTNADNAGTAIKHTYKKAGDYTVTLEVRNGSKTDVVTHNMTVLP